MGTQYSVACKCGYLEEEGKIKEDKTKQPQFYDTHELVQEIKKNDSSNKAINYQVKSVPRLNFQGRLSEATMSGSLDRSAKTHPSSPLNKTCKTKCDDCSQSQFAIISKEIQINDDDFKIPSKFHDYQINKDNILQEVHQIEIQLLMKRQKFNQSVLDHEIKDDEIYLNRGMKSQIKKKSVTFLPFVENESPRNEQHTELVILQHGSAKQNRNYLQNGLSVSKSCSFNPKSKCWSLSKDIEQEQFSCQTNNSDVQYKGELLKHNFRISITYDHTVSYSNKYLIYSKQDIRIFKSQENYLRLLKPCEILKCSKINYSSQIFITNKSGLYHFCVVYDYPDCLKNPVFQEYFSSKNHNIILKTQTKNTSFYQGHPNFKEFCNHLIIFATRHKDEMKKWLSIITKSIGDC